MRGAYFVIVTISFAEVVRLVALNWDELTQGPRALNNIPPLILSIPGLFEFSFIGKVPNYYLVLMAAIVAYVVIARLVHSRVGRAMIALRENEPLAPAPSRRSRAGGVAAVVRAPARATSGRQRKTGRAMNAIPAVALSVDQLSIRFGGVSAVESMTFDVQEGELLSLIGPNGASKTSAFNAISGYLPATGARANPRPPRHGSSRGA